MTLPPGSMLPKMYQEAVQYKKRDVLGGCVWGCGKVAVVVVVIVVVVGGAVGR